MMEHMNYETDTISPARADAPATPTVTKLSTVIFGVFLGNLLTAVVAGTAYALITAR